MRAWALKPRQRSRTPVACHNTQLAYYTTHRVDRVFDVAEQTLAVQRQLALTVAGVATRQVDTAVAAVETTVGERVRRVEDLLEAAEAEGSGGTRSSRRLRRLSRPSRAAGPTGAPMTSAPSRSSGSGRVSCRSKAAPQ